MKKNIILLIIVLSLGLVGCKNKEKVAVKETEDFTGSKYVSVAEVVKADIEAYAEYTGRLAAIEMNDIAPQIPQRIDKIHINEGDFVNKGQLLVSFDKNTVDQLKANYDNVKKNYDRSKELLKSGVIDQKTFDDIEVLYTSTKASYETSMNNLEIRAPFAGIVTNITQKEGENYTSMMSASGVMGLLRIVNLANMKADLSVTDIDLHRIKKGQAVYIFSDANPGTVYHGVVSLISASANAMTGLYQCEVKVNNSKQELKHNQFARFNIVTQKAKNALIIPLSAVIESNIVYVVEDGKAIRREVKTGISSKDSIQIIDGLFLGETVIVDGNIGIADGISVVVR